MEIVVDKQKLRKLFLREQILDVQIQLIFMGSQFKGKILNWLLVSPVRKRLELLAGKVRMASKLGSKLSWMPMMGMRGCRRRRMVWRHYDHVSIRGQNAAVACHC